MAIEVMLTSVHPAGRTHLAPRPYSSCRTRLVLCGPMPRTVTLNPPRASCHTPRLCPARPARASHGHTEPASCLVPHTSLVPRAAPPAPRTVLPRAALTSLHCAVTSTEAYVATVCFVRFRCMLHIFHLNFTKVDLVLHMLLYTYV
jgi:hypothetical protein